MGANYKPSRYLEVHRKRNGHETHLRLIAATVWIGQRLSSWSHTLSLAWTVNGTERKCLANYLQTSSVWKAVSLQKVYNNDKLMGPLSRARPIVHHPSSETCKLITHKKQNAAHGNRCQLNRTLPPWTQHLRSSWVFPSEIVWRVLLSWGQWSLSDLAVQISALARLKTATCLSRETQK